jgi:hypothetical protein
MRQRAGPTLSRFGTEPIDERIRGAEMVSREPVTELDPRYSSEGAPPTEWAEAREHLAAAEVFWVSTVRPDGRPHVTPLLAVWLDDALHFTSGPEERKVRNLVQNPRCVLTTGCNTFQEGLDLVVEGDAVQVREDAVLRRVARVYESKYGAGWRFDVRNGAFHHPEGGQALVYELAPSTAFGFRKGEYSQTRWRFEPEPSHSR